MRMLSAYKFRLYPDEEREKSSMTSSGYARSSIMEPTTKGWNITRYR